MSFKGKDGVIYGRFGIWRGVYFLFSLELF